MKYSTFCYIRSMKSKLILFDIDKTLVKSMHRELDPWKIAFEKVYGVKDLRVSIPMEKPTEV